MLWVKTPKKVVAQRTRSVDAVAGANCLTVNPLPCRCISSSGNAVRQGCILASALLPSHRLDYGRNCSESRNSSWWWTVHRPGLRWWCRATGWTDRHTAVCPCGILSDCWETWSALIVAKNKDTEFRIWRPCNRYNSWGQHCRSSHWIPVGLRGIHRVILRQMLPRYTPTHWSGLLCHAALLVTPDWDWVWTPNCDFTKPVFFRFCCTVPIRGLCWQMISASCSLFTWDASVRYWADGRITWRTST